MAGKLGLLAEEPMGSGFGFGRTMVRSSSQPYELFLFTLYLSGMELDRRRSEQSTNLPQSKSRVYQRIGH